MILENLRKFENRQDVLRKYQWLAQYFNIVLEENSEAKVEKIELMQLTKFRVLISKVRKLIRNARLSFSYFRT